MVISTAVKKNGTVEISADGEPRFAIPAEIWYSSSHFDGEDIEEAELESLRRLSGSFYAYESAVRMLSLRAHSAYELKMKLQKKYGAEAAADAVEKCRLLGYINDGEFAKQLASELYERKCYAPSRILCELNERGISREDARLAVKNLDFDAERCIIYMAGRYLPQNADVKQRKTFISRLMRLGYSYTEIRASLGELFERNDDSV